MSLNGRLLPRAPPQVHAVSPLCCLMPLRIDGHLVSKCRCVCVLARDACYTSRPALQPVRVSDEAHPLRQSGHPCHPQKTARPAARGQSHKSWYVCSVPLFLQCQTALLLYALILQICSVKASSTIPASHVLHARHGDVFLRRLHAPLNSTEMTERIYSVPMHNFRVKVRWIYILSRSWGGRLILVSILEFRESGCRKHPSAPL